MTALGLLFILIFTVAFFQKRSSKAQTQADESFWERENRANVTRRQDLSNLQYINIPLDDFPIGKFKDAPIAEPEERLTALSERKILNLGNQSNTDLKLQYGIANLEFLSECDQNFTSLCLALADYATALYEAGHVSEAKTVLEFGISCGSDVSKNYLLLGTIYKEQGALSALDALIETASALTSLMKDSIIRQLTELRNQ